jgi:hypothetical protein
MELKNAVTVCLIALFSATLVVLIARALDSQAASRLEPQLAAIVEELQAIRKGGGITATSDGPAEGQTVSNGLMVYYFHGNTRCVTCRAIESQSYAAVQSDFAPQVKSGKVAWKILNYEQPAGAELAKEFGVAMPVVVLARMKDGRIEGWKRLDRVWALVGNKPAFAEYVRNEITQVLGATTPQTATLPGDPPVTEVPSVDPGELPVPTDPAAIPLPE